VFLPWNVEETFWKVLHADHASLLAAAVSWAMAEPPIVTVEGPGLLDVVPWQSEDGATLLHVVNLTGPMAMRGYQREPIPVGPLRVTLKARGGPHQVSAHWEGDVRDVEASGDQISFLLPRLVEHELVTVSR
jgi:hypothetical protein